MLTLPVLCNFGMAVHTQWCCMSHCGTRTLFRRRALRPMLLRPRFSGSPVCLVWVPDKGRGPAAGHNPEAGGTVQTSLDAWRGQAVT